MADDYKELIQFLGKKFERIDEQFEEMRNTFATKDDLKAQADEYLHQNRIMNEETQRKIDLLVEGFKGINEARGRDKAETDSEIKRLDEDSLRARAELTDHEKRIIMLERKV